MQIICVDANRDERERTVAQCRTLPQAPEVLGFACAEDALRWLAHSRVDIALLEIDLPEQDGLALARTLEACRPELPVLFLTSRDDCAVEAFAAHAKGYLLKPASAGELKREIDYALSLRRFSPSPSGERAVVVRTFGEFDLYVDGERVAFARSKAKEILAYLVDRQGGSVRRGNLFAALWEDAEYDRPMQKQLDVMIRSLRMTLEKCGAARILEVKNGSLRVIPELFSCDMYRFMSGERSPMNPYRGEYMSSYSWASPTEAYLDRIIRQL